MSDDNSGYPSMTALLALLAVAGFQNRDKLAEWFGGGRETPAAGQAPADVNRVPPSGEAYDDFRKQAGTGGIGGAIAGGIGELVDRFRQIGRGEAADSWVASGPNRPVEHADLESAIGPQGMEMLQRKTGLSRDELLARLQRDLPDAVDRYTPQGRLAAG